jgi:hypothetical protein
MYFFKARYDFFFNEKLDRMQTQNFYLFILYIYFCIFVSPHLEKKKKTTQNKPKGLPNTPLNQINLDKK